MADAVVTTALDQTERAFQKQPTVFLGYKKLLSKKAQGGLRWTRNVGLGFKTPVTAVKVRRRLRWASGGGQKGGRRLGVGARRGGSAAP